MKIQNFLVNLTIVFGLLFCLAFACNDDKTGETDSSGSAKSKNRATGDSKRADLEDETADTENGGFSDGAATSGLPAGTYACFTTVAIYAGQGGGGGYTYPIYNYSRQTRGSIDVKSDGTYSVGRSRCH